MESTDCKKSGRHRRKRYAPLATRIAIFNRASALRKEGLSYSKIIQAVDAEFGIKPSKGQLSDWLRGNHSPLGSANSFTPEPVPELAYVIGVELGDGSLNRRGYNRRIRLSAVDLEFVMEFDRCLSAVLNTRRHKPWFDKPKGFFAIEARSVLLYEFLRKRWGRLRPWVEHCPRCVAAFVRGFFDSEGCVSARQITCSNSDFSLLRFIQRLLKSGFGIQTTGPRLGTRAGTTIAYKGKTYVRKSDCYSIRVRAASIPAFHRYINFTIKRKADRLEAALPGPLR